MLPAKVWSGLGRGIGAFATTEGAIDSRARYPLGDPHKLERMVGIEPTAECLEGTDSATELHPQTGAKSRS